MAQRGGGAAPPPPGPGRSGSAAPRGLGQSWTSRRARVWAATSSAVEHHWMLSRTSRSVTSSKPMGTPASMRHGGRGLRDDQPARPLRELDRQHAPSLADSSCVESACASCRTRTHRHRQPDRRPRRGRSRVPSSRLPRRRVHEHRQIMEFTSRTSEIRIRVPDKGIRAPQHTGVGGVRAGGPQKRAAQCAPVVDFEVVVPGSRAAGRLGATRTPRSSRAAPDRSGPLGRRSVPASPRRARSPAAPRLVRRGSAGRTPQRVSQPRLTTR